LQEWGSPILKIRQVFQSAFPQLTRISTILQKGN
jgi:hypothetical protein